MEITLESIISFIGLFVGGGAGAFFTWRYQRKKAKAEAESAEVDAAKELQDLYQQMLADSKTERDDRKAQIEELRAERDHYKSDRDELREKVDKLTKMFYELKTEGEKERAQLRVSIATLQSQLKGIINLTCSVQNCKLRQVIVFTDDKKKRSTKADAEPLKNSEL